MRKLAFVLGYLLLNICYNISVSTLSLSLASLLLGTAPVFVILFGRILFGEKITKVKIACMLVALAGCVLLSGVLESGGLKWSMFGIAVGVASAVCNGAYALVVNEATDVRKIHPLTILFYSCGITVLLTIPLTDFQVMVHFVADQPLYGGGLLLAHALVASLIPNLLFTTSLRYIDSGVASILASGAEPTSAMLFGLLFYSEIPTVPGVIGMAMTITAMAVLTRSNK